MTDVLIAKSGATPIGNNISISPFTGNAPLNDAQYHNSGNGTKGAYCNTTPAWGGLTFATPQNVSRFDIWGWDDRGIIDGPSLTGTDTVAIAIMASTSAFGPGNGTQIGSATLIEPGNVPLGSNFSITCDPTSAWTNVWYEIPAMGSGYGVTVSEVDAYTPSTGTGGGTGGTGGTGGSTGFTRPMMLMPDYGQSNDVNPGPAVTYTNNARIWAWNGSAIVQATPDIALGFSMPMADALIPMLNLPIDILIVSQGLGGNPLSVFLPGTAQWNNMISRVQAAKAAAPAGSFYGPFHYVQGESDTGSTLSVRSYMQNVPSIYSGLRSALGVSDLPVIHVGKGPNPGVSSMAAWDTMQVAEEVMAIPAPYAYVKTYDLPNVSSNADWLIDSSRITIGQRIAAAARSLLPLPL